MSAVRPGGSIYVIRALAGAGSINPRMINRKGIRLQSIHVGSRDMFADMNRAIALHKLKPASTGRFCLQTLKPLMCISRAIGTSGRS